MAAPSHCRILIVDFGAQYTQLIARRLRELHVYCEIHPYDVGDDFIRAFAPRGIVLSGGPNSVTEGDTPRAPTSVWSQGVPDPLVIGRTSGVAFNLADLFALSGDMLLLSAVAVHGVRHRHELGQRV